MKMFELSVLIHGTCFTAKVDRAKLQHMISVYGRQLLSADQAVKHIEEWLELDQVCKYDLAGVTYHISNA